MVGPRQQGVVFGRGAHDRRAPCLHPADVGPKLVFARRPAARSRRAMRPSIAADLRPASAQRRRLLRLRDPRWGCSGLLSQEHVQLGGVLLHMAHGVQQQLGKGQLAPGEAAHAVRLLR